jgi:Peptidase A4 family
MRRARNVACWAAAAAGVVTLAAACAGSGKNVVTQTAAAPPAQRTHGTFTAAQFSSNWAGYVVRSKRAGAHAFTSARGTWRMPSVSCNGADGSSAAFWVGIGGFGAASPSLQQLGGSADCNPDGTTSYRLWTEIVPEPARFLPLRVAPGDTISALVSMAGRKVTLTIQNVSRRTRYSTTVTVRHALDVSTAEWVAEAPALCRTASQCEVVPLSDFGTVSFSSISATAGKHSGPLRDPWWTVTPVVLVTSAGASRYTAATNPSGAIPAAVSTSGKTFSVVFRTRVGGTVPSSPLLGAPLPDWVH